ncbi:hypothetical protein, conserved [Leishmania tarentolae]|uniref:Uncharacterized protein n=1 Tax=Leishmania tarentolae TaxID=5689 RepID=A0A640KMT7_LEITA|nr:hypothetical protein, conserved [Leishmania tarentolae]
MRTSSPRGTHPSRFKQNNVNLIAQNPLSFSVQDRRVNTRLLKETQRRKAQLLGMTRHDVARQLHRYTVQPSSIMDEGCQGGLSRVKSASHTKFATGGGRKATSEVGADAISATGSPLSTYSGTGESSPSSKDLHSRWQTQYAKYLQKKEDTADHSLNPSTSPGEDDEQTGLVMSGPPTASYEEWLSTGCPTGPWFILLHEEFYAPLEAEQAFLGAKYNPKQRPQS